ncbi:unnamed protein product [Nippostrongylus brasiliensis]|uniref:EB domain-containing protein n=1 Tax=Nippostrongylus brasiliensis TaxID=27835 RepID=A0A0N4YM50_NIPBR|nr:unnamed protein product [Nippostrongylus brasiliensis]
MSETMHYFLPVVVFSLIPAVAGVGQLINDNPLIRHKRLTYYLCGVTPNQYYSTTQFISACITQNVCSNGGTFLNIGCQYSAQCTPFYSFHFKVERPPALLDVAVLCQRLSHQHLGTDSVSAHRASCLRFAAAVEVNVKQGVCPSGFTCQNGFCCPQCPNNVMPFGTCRNGACGGGTTCRAGNICC